MGDVIIAVAVIFMYVLAKLTAIHLEKKSKKTSRLNAWKVRPELADRFLNVLADNNYKWMSGHEANELGPIQDSVPLLFIEGATKRFYYMRYFSYPDNLEEEFNVTDVTEEWLQKMEKNND